MILVLEFYAPDFPYRLSAVVFSGLWALVPDFHYVSPVFGEPLAQIKRSVVGNVFWFHAYLDSLHQGRGTREMAVVMIVLLFLAAIVSDYRRSTGD